VTLLINSDVTEAKRLLLEYKIQEVQFSESAGNYVHIANISK